LGASDETLTTVLEHHRGLLKQSFDEEPNDDGSMDKIPDIVLSKQYSVGPSQTNLRHLVIELKRPSVKISMDEKNQIEKYASTVAKNDNFDKSKTAWDFYVVSSDIADDANGFRSKDPGNYGEIGSPNKSSIRIFIRTWGEILQEAEGKLKYLLNKLELKTSSDAGHLFLQKKYPEIIKNIKDKMK
jgi:hypothetical protein